MQFSDIKKRFCELWGAFCLIFIWLWPSALRALWSRASNLYQGDEFFVSRLIFVLRHHTILWLAFSYLLSWGEGSEVDVKPYRKTRSKLGIHQEVDGSLQVCTAAVSRPVALQRTNHGRSHLAHKPLDILAYHHLELLLCTSGTKLREETSK